MRHANWDAFIGLCINENDKGIDPKYLSYFVKPLIQGYTFRRSINNIESFVLTVSDQGRKIKHGLFWLIP